jgi:AmmeMemoRadiSam system protein A
MKPGKRTVGTDLGLLDEEKRELHRIARTVIESRAAGKPAPQIVPAFPKLAEKFGAFVSIHKRGMLRGCIGCLTAEDALHKTVEEMAEAAAFRDPRFTPVQTEELPHLDLEISVLTPFVEIEDTEDIQVGVHGIMIRKGNYSGLLLPQVAAERNWDTITFLEETCRKAGLSKNAWQDKETKIYVFSADVF